MFRMLPAIVVLLANSACMSAAEDGDHNTHCTCNKDATTLRLYFSPDITDEGRFVSEFKPKIAKLYVDDRYAGDAVVNLHGYVPTLRFSKSTVSLRVEMSDNRKFETKVTFLGNGSTQVLYVDFSKPLARTEERGE